MFWLASGSTGDPLGFTPAGSRALCCHSCLHGHGCVTHPGSLTVRLMEERHDSLTLE